MKPISLHPASQIWPLWAGIAGLCFIAFISIFLTVDHIFEYVPHSEDEVAYLFQAKVLAENRLTVPTPPQAHAFWSPFVIDYQQQRFGKYPPGWPLLLSLGVRLGAPWLINAGLATGTLALIGLLGYLYYCADETGGSRCLVPLLAVGLGVVTPGFLFLSSSLLSHAASLFWVTLALVALFQAVTAPRYRHVYSFGVGAALGATFITRPFAALGVGLAVGIFVIGLVLRRELQVSMLLWITLGGLLVSLLLPLFWWAAVGDPTFNAYLLVWPYDRVGFGPDIGPHGYTLQDAIFINTRLKLLALATGLFGWPGWTNLLFLPIPFLARQANRWDWLLLGTIGGLIFVHLFYWAFGGVDGGFPRYYYDALPAFLLLTARGIEQCGQWLRRLAGIPPRQTIATGVLAGILLTLVAYNLFWHLPPLLAAQKGKYGITPAPLQAVEQADISTPALILVQDVDKWSDFAAPFAANSPMLDGPLVYAIDGGEDSSRSLRASFAGRSCYELQGENVRECPPLAR
ncbi:MAG TPA: hypothetical protein P5526_18915 [Anaerolineae bacterium]|mgnify:CR=1 FL=1|nr:hypothetical protein [Anaerolineae bacterium]